MDDLDEDLISAELWNEIEARLDADEGMTPHGDVVRAFRDREKS